MVYGTEDESDPEKLCTCESVMVLPFGKQPTKILSAASFDDLKALQILNLYFLPLRTPKIRKFVAVYYLVLLQKLNNQIGGIHKIRFKS